LHYLCRLQKLLTILFFLIIGGAGLSTAQAGSVLFDTGEPTLKKIDAKAGSLSLPGPVAEPVELLTYTLLAKHRLTASGLTALTPAVAAKSRVPSTIPVEQAPGEYAVSHHLRCLYPFYAFW
jgi:hypothetical protein